MNAFRKILLALTCALCAANAHAGYAVQYFVGYGLYPPAGPFEPGPVGLLAVNGSHRALVQLIWAGPNAVDDGPQPLNAAGGYVDGDDVVLDSRILEAGSDGVDEWGYAASLPPPFVTTNSLLKPVFVRVHQDATPGDMNHWYHDTPLCEPADQPDSATPWNVFADVIHVETGNETVPTACIVLDQVAYPILEGPWWTPDSPTEPEIQFLELDPATAGLSFPIPYSYSFHALYGAATTRTNGDWEWQLLEVETDYTVADGVVTIRTTGENLPTFRVLRLGLIHDF